MSLHFAIFTFLEILGLYLTILAFNTKFRVYISYFWLFFRIQSLILAIMTFSLRIQSLHHTLFWNSEYESHKNIAIIASFKFWVTILHLAILTFISKFIFQRLHFILSLHLIFMTFFGIKNLHFAFLTFVSEFRDYFSILTFFSLNPEITFHTSVLKR